ncbi:MAG: 3-dehydroquinate synthase [Bacteroides sp.]|jgi:3-dehydroquinate synthase|nr:3-dehydroquinate synthase [Bacteroides sp.]
MSQEERMLNHPVFFESKEEKYFAKFLDFHVKSGESVFVLTDQNTREHCLPLLRKKLPDGFPLKVIEVPAGEKHKNLETCQSVWEILTDKLADRNSVLINLGGGVVCDLGGFAASVFKRGIRFVHVPTSLMAMADASIGGKTGIDLHGIKNVIGTFAQPLAVFIDTEFLQTLPERDLNNGFSEMLKHGLISEYSFFKELAEGGPENVTSEQIRISVEIKSDIVQRDPLERNIRKSLNFGHTLGHAFETYSLLNDANPLLHGEAVILGMMGEILLSERMNLLDETYVEEILSALFDFAVYYDFTEASIHSVMEFVQHDKKSQRGIPGFSLLRRPGQVITGQECSEEDIISVLVELKEILQDQ